MGVLVFVCAPCAYSQECFSSVADAFHWAMHSVCQASWKNVWMNEVVCPGSHCSNVAEPRWPQSFGHQPELPPLCCPVLPSFAASQPCGFEGTLIEKPHPWVFALTLTYYHTHNASDTSSQWVPHTKQLSVTPAECPIIQFNSILTLTEVRADLIGWGLSPIRLSPTLNTNCNY